MDTTALVLVNVHIVAGFVALASMWVPLIIQKGSRTHKLWGKVYACAMLVVAVTALAIVPVRLAQGRDPRFPLFLAYIALFSFAMLAHGLRMLTQKKRAGASRDPVALGVPIAVIVLSVAMMVYGQVSRTPLLAWFPLVGLGVSLGFLATLLRPPKDRMWWWYEHMTGMVGSCIATITAFLVANQVRVLPGLPPLLVWLLPTIVGTPAIVLWTIKYRKQFGVHPPGRPKGSARGRGRLILAARAPGGRMSEPREPTRERDAGPLPDAPRRPEDRSPENTTQRHVRVAAEQANVYATALTFVGSVIFFAVGGLLLDLWLGTTPWLVLLGLVIGLFGGSWKFVREAKALGKQ